MKKTNKFEVPKRRKAGNLQANDLAAFVLNKAKLQALKGETHRISLDIDKEHIKLLKAYAISQDKTLSYALREAVEEYLSSRYQQ